MTRSCLHCHTPDPATLEYVAEVNASLLAASCPVCARLIWIDTGSVIKKPIVRRTSPPLTWEIVREIRRAAKEVSIKDLAVKYGKTHTAISLIVAGKRWVEAEECSPSPALAQQTSM